MHKMHRDGGEPERAKQYGNEYQKIINSLKQKDHYRIAMQVTRDHTKLKYACNLFRKLVISCCRYSVKLEYPPPRIKISRAAST